MSQTVSLWGATYSDVPSIVVPSGNSTASFTDVTPTTAAAADVASGKYFFNASGVLTLGTASGGGTGGITQDANGYLVLSDQGGGGGGGSWSWMGNNATKVKTVHSDKVYLEDTAYATWTPSTTAATLVSGSTLTPETVDCADYDYYFVGRFHTHFEYGSGATQAALVNDYYCVSVRSVYGYSSDLSGITDGTAGLTNDMSLDVTTGLFYKNSSGNDTFSSSYNYGVYANSWSLESSGTGSGSSRTVTLQTPNITARCNGSYFSTANAAAVNQSASYYEIAVEIYKVDRNTSALSGKYQLVRDMWLNGF